MGSTKHTAPADLLPIDWPSVERHYRAGIRTLRSIGEQYGCTHAAIQKRAKRDGWTRDLSARIHARASELVAKVEVAREVAEDRKRAEQQTIEVAAQAELAVRLGHRKDIAKLRKVGALLLAELESVTEFPELYARVHLALSDPSEAGMQALRDMANLVSSLPQRTKLMRDLAEAMHRVIGMEREAFGLDTAGGTDGKPIVVIKDFTGRGDVDAPPRPATVEEAIP